MFKGVVVTRHGERTTTSQNRTQLRWPKAKKACLIQNRTSLILKIVQKRKNLGGIDGPILRGWNPVTHEAWSLRTGAPGLGERRMSGEAGYLSPASQPVPLVLCMSLIGPGWFTTVYCITLLLLFDLILWNCRNKVLMDSNRNDINLNPVIVTWRYVTFGFIEISTSKLWPWWAAGLFFLLSCSLLLLSFN